MRQPHLEGLKVKGIGGFVTMHPAEFCLAVHGGDKGKTAERTYEVVAEREQAEVFAWIP